MTPPLELRCDGPADAATTVLLAHGAGAGMDHAFLVGLAAGLAGHGLRVARFEFAYMRARHAGNRRGPDRMPVLQETMREAVAMLHAPRLVLMGKSMGGRVATMLADELGAAAVVAIGYPFHPPKKPEQLRTEHLATLRTHTLILQGERDVFGTREEVAGYDLSPAITVQWFADGDHSLEPRKRSGHTALGHFAAAIEAAAAFCAP